MAAARTILGAGRYSPPVSPRTISTEPSPNVAIEGDDYFLDQLSCQADKSNKGSTSVYQGKNSENDHPKSTSPPSNDKPRPPPLHLRTSHKSETKPRKLSDPRSQMVSPGNSKPLSAVCLDLRPLQELLNERSYLLYNLQKQDERATSLFRRYATLEAKLAEAQTPKEARKIRKDAKLLKHKITESTQQEQLIFLRLGEIYIETQNRERWMQFRYPQSATFPKPVYFPPLYYGAGEVAVPPPPPPSVQGIQSSYPLTPYLTAQQSPAFSYSNSSSALSPFSPDFVPGVKFSEDIWARPGPSSQASMSPQNQNFYRINADTKPSIESRAGLMPKSAADVVEEEYDENKWHQEEDDDDSAHGIVPWHELKHNVEGTSTPPQTNGASNGESAVESHVDDDTEDGETPATTTAGDDSEMDEETRIFKNYLRAVSLHDDAISPSALSPHNCYNWAGPGECGGRGVGGLSFPGNTQRRRSLPSLPRMGCWGSAGGHGESRE
ncbi:hypothetical protein V8F20_003827 [Naviculisporaceae sp. PSN 640]